MLNQGRLFDSIDKENGRMVAAVTAGQKHENCKNPPFCKGDDETSGRACQG
jgi:hypothetical protein